MKDRTSYIKTDSSEEYVIDSKELSLYRFILEMKNGEQSIHEKGTVSHEELKKELGIKETNIKN